MKYKLNKTIVTIGLAILVIAMSVGIYMVMRNNVLWTLIFFGLGVVTLGALIFFVNILFKKTLAEEQGMVTLKKLQNTVVTVLVVINIVMLVGLSNRLYFRADLTDGQKYSISKSTKDLIKNLDNKLVVTYHYNKRSEEIPEIAPVIRYIDDILKEYQSQSKGMVEYKPDVLSFSNPSDMEKIAELQEKGIQTVSVSQTGDAEASQSLGFSGVTLSYMGKEEIMGVVFQDEGFEFEMNVRINRLIGENEKSIGIVIGTQGPTLERDYEHLNQYLTREYVNVRQVEPANIPEDVEYLIILGADKFDEFDVFNIEQFMLSGGKVFFAFGGATINFGGYGGGPVATPSMSPMIDVIESYGVKLNRDLVGDNDSYNPVAKRSAFFVEEQRYPIWPNIIKENINGDHPIVENFRSLNMFWPSSISIEEKGQDKATMLFTTTEAGWRETSNMKIAVEDYKYPMHEGSEKLGLGVAFDGSIESFFSGKEVPQSTEGKSYEGDILTSAQAKFVLVSNQFFVSNDFLNREDEITLVLNSIDWLSGGSSLIDIRSKGRFARPLNKVRNRTQKIFMKNMIIGISTYLLPVLFIILAFVLIINRKRKMAIIAQRILNKNNEDQGGKE